MSVGKTAFDAETEVKMREMKRWSEQVSPKSDKRCPAALIGASRKCCQRNRWLGICTPPPAYSVKRLHHARYDAQ